MCDSAVQIPDVDTVLFVSRYKIARVHCATADAADEEL